jgi:hypothetical protein
MGIHIHTDDIMTGVGELDSKGKPDFTQGYYGNTLELKPISIRTYPEFSNQTLPE